MSKQTALAAVLLLLLGYVYGSHDSASLGASCAPSDTQEATLTKTVALAPHQARYVFTRSDGCNILVYAPRFPVLVRGSVAQISGAQDTPHAAFASLPEYADYLREEDISLVVRDAELALVRPSEEYMDSFRVHVIQRIETLFHEPDASLLSAMLTGEKGMIPENVRMAYLQSGIIHILSISGLHVSVIAVVLTFGIGFLRVSPAIRSLLIFLLLWIYIVGVDSPASAVRAGVFWTCYTLAYHMRALVGVLTVVLLTLAVLLTHTPSLAKSIGFALFFMRNIRPHDSRTGIGTLVGISAGAIVATAPLTMYYFGNFSIVGLVTNVLVVPLIPFVTYLALISLFLQPIAYPLALVGSYIVHLLLSWVLLVARVGARIPYGHFENIVFPAWGIAVYYGIVGIVIIFLMRRLGLSWRRWWV